MPVTFPASVSTEAELRDAIFAISNDFAADATVTTDYVVNLTADIDLTQSLPMIRGDGIHTITFNGGGHTIDAQGNGRVFFVESGKVEINAVTIAGAVADGGDGGASGQYAGGGGGGLGAGAALFVNAGADVTVSGVSITGASATGGAGSSPGDEFGGGGGGGGLGGNGGNGAVLEGGGGGGGYEGNGGSANGAGGGGGGEFGNGASSVEGAAGGGGGGGQQGNGGFGGIWGGGGGGGTGPDDDGGDGSGSTTSGTPGAGGGTSGGNGGVGYTVHEPGAAGGALGGGGGGGSMLDGLYAGSHGGAGGASGGGGGARYVGGSGGVGGLGGGGGGGTAGAGGAGGDFGGGGGTYNGGNNAGSGGFGGGGGGSSTLGGSRAGGTGGFGAGGGGGANSGTAGTYGGTGGSGQSADGGGGAALGGAVFVRDGGKLTIKDGSFTGTYGVTGGTTGGGGGATAGEAHGDVMFLNGATTSVVFEVSTDRIVTIDTSDGGLYDAEVGGIAGDGGIEKTGAGTLLLFGNQTYTGVTKVSAGVLEMRGSLASAISVDDGGTFAGTGEVRGIKVGEGTLTPGAVTTLIGRPSPFASIGMLTTEGLTLGELTTYSVEVGFDEETLFHDAIIVTGAVKLDGALDLAILGDFDVDEATFTIIANDDDDVVDGTFDGLAEGATFEAHGRTFKISYAGGDGNDVTLTLVHIVPPPSGVVIRGTGKNDRIDATHTPKGQPFPGKGDDTIFGNGGNDRIHGLAGDDTIVGGAGADRMWGDAGDDTFVFRSLKDVNGSLHLRGGPAKSDHVYGFVGGEDRIDLSTFDASTAKGLQHFTFIGKQGFHGEARELRYTANGAKTVVLSGDVNGDGRADFNIVVHGTNAVGSGDLILT